MKLRNKTARAAEYSAEPAAVAEDALKEGEEGTETPYKSFATKEEYDKELERAIADAGDGEGETKEPDDRKAAVERIITEWQRGEAELRAVVPDFDLRRAMEDRAFSDALTGGASVAVAYIAMTQGKPKQARREIAQNAQSANKGTGRSQANPATLPAPEFKAYIDRIMNN